MKDRWNTSGLVHLVSTIKAGGTPTSTNREFYDGEIPFVSIEDITLSKKTLLKTKKFLTKKGVNASAAWIVPKGYIIYSMYASVGKVRLLEIDAATSQAIIAFEVIQSKIHKDYLYYYLLKLEKEIYKYTSQTTQANLNAAKIKSFQITYPSLPQQKKIAQILSTCDTVMEQTEAAIAKYQALKLGMLHDLFTRGIDIQTGKLRQSYLDAPELYKETELGFVPREWEVEELGEFIEAIDPQPSHRTPPEFHNGIPYLGINDIQNGEMQFSKCRLVSPEVFKEHKKRYTISNGDIIFGKIGTIGSPKRLILPQIYSLSANVILIKPYDNKDLIFHYLNSKNVENQISRKIHTTSQPAFGMEKIRGLLCPNIPVQEAKVIENKLNAIDQKINTEQQTFAKYEALKAGLMQDLLSGVVGVEGLLNN